MFFNSSCSFCDCAFRVLRIVSRRVPIAGAGIAISRFGRRLWEIRCMRSPGKNVPLLASSSKQILRTSTTHPTLDSFSAKTKSYKGSGCGTVGRVVASKQEDPGSNPVIGNFYWTYFLLTVCRKDENKEKGAENDPFLKKEELETENELKRQKDRKS